MIEKKYMNTNDVCKVTFTLPEDIHAHIIALCGEFNEWNPSSHPMKKIRGSGYIVTLILKVGRSYQFKYVMDGSRWENDPQADRYVPDGMGSDNSVIDL